MSKQLSNKVILVTGGAVGIGRSTALLMADQGASLAIVDLNEEMGEQTASLARDRGSDAIFVKADTSNVADITSAVSRIIERFGRIDALVNNAGVVLIADIEGTEEEDFRRVVDVNYKGVFFFAKAVIPIMKRQGRGVIVNVASVSAHIGQPRHAAYAGTKGAVLSMTRAMAAELAPYGIRVNSVSPGAVDTPMLRSDMDKQSKSRGIPLDDVRREFASESAMKRISSPSEIAPVIAFLCSEQSSYMTGADVLVDGGWVAK